MAFIPFGKIEGEGDGYAKPGEAVDPESGLPNALRLAVHELVL